MNVSSSLHGVQLSMGQNRVDIRVAPRCRPILNTSTSLINVMVGAVVRRIIPPWRGRTHVVDDATPTNVFLLLYTNEPTEDPSVV